MLFTIIYILIKFCSGGKGNTLTFLTNESFSLALMSILKKDKKKIQVNVEFDTHDVGLSNSTPGLFTFTASVFIYSR